jgi:hypothetical protein
MSGSTGVKISDATPAAPLSPTDMVPIARKDTDAPFNATIQDFATYVTILASQSAPPYSDPTGAGHAGVQEQYARADHVHPTNPDVAMSNSPSFTGNPTAPTPPKDDNSKSLATTAYVVGQAAIRLPLMSAVADPGVSLRYAREDHVHPVPPVAPLDSPHFTGTPRVPTPGIDDNTDLIATTAYVQNQGSTKPPLMAGPVLPGVSSRWTREDHVHPVDTSRYAASNPAGYVNAQGAAAAAPVQSVATRTGMVTLTHTDITDWTTSLAPYALLQSPAFLGQPTAPSPPTSDASTRLATTSYVRMGTTTNDNAGSGQVGEYFTAQVLQSASIPLTTNTAINICQITLSPGDWGVSGNAGFDCTGAGGTSFSCGISVVSAQLPQSGTPMNSVTYGGNTTVTHTNMPIPATRISLASPAIIYLVASSIFPGAVSTTAYGSMNARRIR